MLKLNTTQRFKRAESIPREVSLVLGSICLSSKNIYNATLFIVKSGLSNYSYDKDAKTYKVKDNRHQNKIDILNIKKRIDGYKSDQYTAELKTIQAKIDSNRKNESNKEYIPLMTTKKEYDLNKKSLKAIHSNECYRKLVIRKNNIVNYFIHKVSWAIINDCKSKNIKFDLVIISKWGIKSLARQLLIQS